MAGYGDDTAFAAWLSEQGFALPAGSPTPAALRQRGSGYVDAYCFPGVPTGGFAQERAWPRTGAEAYGQAIPSDTVPSAIVQASYAAGYFEALNPGALTSRSSLDAGVKRKRVRVEGAVDTETEYFADGSAAPGAGIEIPMVEALLKPFIIDPAGEPTVFIV